MGKSHQVISALRSRDFSRQVLLDALQLTDENQSALFNLAQECRLERFSDNQAQTRSVIEISNICGQKCRYCAIGGLKQVKDYTLSTSQIVMLADYLYQKGRRVILLQSGENTNPVFIDDVVNAIKKLKSLYPEVRIILCLGNLTHEQYQDLYDAGASDYILKFETSNKNLFKYCKPNDEFDHRLACIQDLCEIGFRVGSGNIVGLPQQTLDDLVNDLELVHQLPLAMNSATIFIPAENSEFANEKPGNPNYTLNMMALMRIMNPDRLMPTTSSLEKMIPDGQYLGLLAGANTITIHDGTPEELQQFFPIYSSKRIRPQIDHFRDILNRAGLRADIIN